MSTKPTIYKFRLHLADLDREVYHAEELTLALHPSETAQRMLARLFAWCLLVVPGQEPPLRFGKGLSDTDEPDLWRRDHDGSCPLWVLVGEPTPERVKRAARLATQLAVISHNAKSATWWAQGANKLRRDNARFVQLEAAALDALALQLQRTQDWSVSIAGQVLDVHGDAIVHSCPWREYR